MAEPRLACLAGTAIYRLQEEWQFPAQRLGPRATPFGQSEVILLVEGDAPFYLLSSHGEGTYRRSAGFVNHRANLYALKDMGVQCVLGWSAAGAISHNFGMGDMVLLSDLIDRTTKRPHTFYENSGLGVLRQFPVFCPSLREGLKGVLAGLSCRWHEKATLAVTEGPRLETPAEVRMLATAGAELVGHSFAPEAFLAKELELCFAAVAYVVNYAETGSSHRPYSAQDLFGGMTASSEADRIGQAISSLPELVRRLSGYVATAKNPCECGGSMRHEAEKFGLPDDWRQWF